MKENINLPQEIIDAYNKKDLVVFIGAGMSRLMGCQGWDDLANKLIKELFNCKESNTILNANLSAKEKISIAYNKSKEDKNENTFYRIMKESFEPNKKEEDIYKLIIRFNCIFATTNADGLFEKYFNENNVSLKCRSDEIESDQPRLFYLHGRFNKGKPEDIETLVFTTEKYLNRYRDSKYIEFLTQLLATKTVLFLGYGFNEFELIDHLFSKTTTKKTFILEGYFSNEDDLYNVKKSYYESIGITLLSYNKDKDGFRRQYSIIDNWTNQLYLNSLMSSRIFDEIDRLLNEYNENNYLELKRVIINNKDKKSSIAEMFRMLPNSNYCVEYIDKYWKDSELNSLDPCPEIIEKNGGYSSPCWEFADCLIRSLNEQRDNDCLYDLTKSIIIDVINNINKEEKLKLNYNLSRQLIEIIFLLPPEFLDRVLVCFLCDEKRDLFSKEYIAYDFYKINPKFLCISGELENVLHNYVFGFYVNNEKCYCNVKDVYKFYTNNKQFFKNKLIDLSICIKNMFSCFKNEEFVYYLNFETLCLKNEYYKNMFELVNSIVNDLDNKKVRSLIKDFAKKASSSFEIQLIFYLAKLCNMPISFIKLFPDNPLNYQNTLCDVYSYLSKKNSISDNNANYLLELIKKATFNYDTKYLDIINTDKMVLLSVLKEKNSMFNKYYNDINTDKHCELYDPIERAKERIPKLDFVHIDPLFSQEELDSLSLEELVEKLDKSINGYLYHYEWFDEIVAYVTEKNLYSELLDLLSNFKGKADTISGILQSISNQKNIKLFDNKSDLDKLVNLLYNSSTYSHSPESIKINIIRMFKLYKENTNIQKIDLLNKLLSINIDLLWSNDKSFEEYMLFDDTVTTLINNSQGKFYLLLIDLMFDVKDNTKALIESVFILLKNKINSDNYWTIFALCANYQNMYNINSEFAAEIFKMIFDKPEKIGESLRISCSYTKCIYKELTSAILQESNLIKLFSENKIENNKQIIYYITSAFELDLINQEEFTFFISFLSEEQSKSIFWQLSKVCKEDNNEDILKVILLVYDNIKTKIQNGDIYVEIVSAITNTNIINDKVLGIIKDAIENEINNTYLEYNLYEFFKTHKNYYHKDFVSSFVKHIRISNIHDEDTIFSIIDSCITHDINQVYPLITVLNSRNIYPERSKKVCEKLERLIDEKNDDEQP